MEKAFAAFFIAFFVVMVVLYGVLTEYSPPANRQLRYGYFQDVNVMIFIGFGFLMCFLAKGSFTATSHAFVVAAFSVLWAILNRGFWHRVFQFEPHWDKLQIQVDNLIGADFCAGSILIAFGAMIGRITLSQLMMMALIQVVMYSINEGILLRLGVADIGGSMVIHAFGAYFGLACSFVLEKLRPVPERPILETAKVGTRINDTIAMVGTIFLFCYWPSFNAALAGETSMDRAAVNTFLAILSSCVAACLVNVLLHHDSRITMEVMQNSTIAGGVAMGCAADMVVNPFGAMITGFVAGAISCAGYLYLSAVLEEKIGLRDTCGVHNLHGMPGFLGAIVGAIAAGARQLGSYRGTMGDVFYHQERSSEAQAGHQMAGLGISLGIALLTGAITGAILAQMPGLPEFFDDHIEYVTPEAHAHGNAHKHTDQVHFAEDPQRVANVPANEPHAQEMHVVTAA